MIRINVFAHQQLPPQLLNVLPPTAPPIGVGGGAHRVQLPVQHVHLRRYMFSYYLLIYNKLLFFTNYSFIICYLLLFVVHYLIIFLWSALPPIAIHICLIIYLLLFVVYYLIRFLCSPLFFCQRNIFLIIYLLLAINYYLLLIVSLYICATLIPPVKDVFSALFIYYLIIFLCSFRFR